MKTYKINGVEIQQLSYGRVVDYELMQIRETINQLLEALSDKEEYCGWCDMKITESGHFKQCSDYKPKEEEKPCRGCALYALENMTGFIPNKCVGDCKPKQSTSLKEEVRKLVKECVYVAELSSEKISDKILSLIQSHLLKEIQPLTRVKTSGPWTLQEEDIIKIINNLK